MGTAETRAKNKFNKKNYDRLAVFVPKGDREIIKAAAKSRGLSTNEYIIRLIYRELGKYIIRLIYRELGKHSPF